MSTIYEIAGSWRQLYEIADDPELDPDVWFDTMEAIEGEFDEKAENYCKLVKQLDADAEGFKKEIERLTARKQALENKAKRCKERLKDAMLAIDRPKIKTELFSLNVQNNPPSVFIADESRVPEQFLVPQPAKIDKKAILEFLKAGNECDYAEIQQGQSLRIR